MVLLWQNLIGRLLINQIALCSCVFFVERPSVLALVKLCVFKFYYFVFFSVLRNEGDKVSVSPIGKLHGSSP